MDLNGFQIGFHTNLLGIIIQAYSPKMEIDQSKGEQAVCLRV